MITFNKKQLALTFAAIGLLTFSSVSLARNITGVTVEWAPHYGSTMPDGGAVTVIVKEAFRRTGHNAQIEFIPWSRALKNVKEGKNDFVMGAYYNDERAQTYFVSNPIYSIDLGLIALDSLGVSTINNLRELSSYTIGVSRGFANTEEFDQADYIQRDVAKSPKLNLRKLFRNRIDMTVGAFDIFRHQAKLEKLDVNRIIFVQPPLQSNALHLLGSRNVADGEQLIADFNQGLAQMIEDGTMKAYLKKYLNRD